MYSKPENWDEMLLEFRKLLSNENEQPSSEFGEWFNAIKSAIQDEEMPADLIGELTELPGVRVERSMVLKFPPRQWTVKEE